MRGEAAPGRPAWLLTTSAAERTRWRPSWHPVSIRFPPMGLFGRVASAENLEIVMPIKGEPTVGAGKRWAISPWCRSKTIAPLPALYRSSQPSPLNPQGSRFNDGSYGRHYGGNTIVTAAATTEPPIGVDMRGSASDIDAEPRTITIVGRQAEVPHFCDPVPAPYGPAQPFARVFAKHNPGAAGTAAFATRGRTYRGVPAGVAGTGCSGKA